ncbi:MAG: DUF3090 domain-containing protein [Caldilineaceae bacterium]|nr:DUF3090 domain-containing protein [Caldilineaceae bacterium]
MTDYLYDLNPVVHLIADAIGEPGNRTFFIQARAQREVVSLVMEKQEVGSLAISVLQLLEELEKSYPDLPHTSRSAVALKPEHPMEPLFRVGQLSIGYDEEEDMVWIVAKALMVNEETQEIVDPNDDNVPGVRFVATRDQMRAMSEHALEVISQGRPVCPLCGRSIDREGHFCARTDGEAMPIIF